MPKQKDVRTRYGIGEWYGKSFVALTAEERLAFADVKFPKSQTCLPRSNANTQVPCIKRGGVCSLRRYQSDPSTTSAVPLQGLESFCTLCPHRFKERNMIFEWVGKVILDHPHPEIVTEVGFLTRDQVDKASETMSDASQNSELSEDGTDDREDVGQIDYVLLHPDRGYLRWCALELQAVYFSGPKMSEEYENIRECPGGQLPFPKKNRRPDYRSSGPKRLMPQLQIKVPTLRRWGKKMAVVVDRGFFNALGNMDRVSDVSNSDILWFIVDYEETGEEIRLVPKEVRYTTLERAVEGLTSGTPVTLSNFESRVIAKLNGPQRKPKSK